MTWQKQIDMQICLSRFLCENVIIICFELILQVADNVLKDRARGVVVLSVATSTGYRR